MKNTNLLSAVMLSALFTLSGSLWAMEKARLRYEDEMGIQLVVVNLSDNAYGVSVEGARKPSGSSKILGQIVVASKRAQPIFIQEIIPQTLDLVNDILKFKVKMLPLQPQQAFDPSQLKTTDYPIRNIYPWEQSNQMAILILPDGTVNAIKLDAENVLTPKTDGRQSDFTNPNLDKAFDYKNILLKPLDQRR